MTASNQENANSDSSSIMSLQYRNLSHVDQRRRPVTKFAFDSSSYGQDQLVVKRPARNLNADGQPFIRLAYRNHRSRRGKQIEPLRVSHGIQVVQFSAFDRPFTFSVTKSRDRAHWEQKQRKFLHLRQKLAADGITV